MQPKHVLPEGLPLYIQAIAEYRLIMRKALGRAVQKYGERAIVDFFNVSDLAVLMNANHPKFVDRRKLSEFLKRVHPRSGLDLDDLYKAFRTNLWIREFTRYMDRHGDRAIANDILFFIEHRIASVRNELLLGLVQQQKTRQVQEAQAHAHAHDR